MMAYDFGPQHPLRPVRLERTVAVLEACVPGFMAIDPGVGSVDDVLRVHSAEFVETVVRLSEGGSVLREEQFLAGFTSQDTPPFRGMYEVSLGYCGAGAKAARDVCNGAELAFNVAGGLHHAKRSRANGFCVFDDAAISLDILREKFDRVLYVDIDLHHGDGPESIFDEVREVATLSIHETGRSLYPGTGFVEDRGSAGTAFNIPLEAHTTGDTWLWAFGEVFWPLMDWLKPEAIVLQTGCDPHTDDPLGHLDCSVQEWLGAVREVGKAGVPMVVCGGGGYALQNVPRMWAATAMTLNGIEVPESLPSSIPAEWGMTTFFDPPERVESGRGRDVAEAVVRALHDRLQHESY